MNEFLHWSGWYGSTADFWHQPLGLLCTGLMLLTSAVRVAHWRSAPSMFDTVWHFLFSTTTAAAFFSGVNGFVPQYVVKSLLVLMAWRGVYKAWRVHRCGA